MEGDLKMDNEEKSPKRSVFSSINSAISAAFFAPVALVEYTFERVLLRSPRIKMFFDIQEARGKKKLADAIVSGWANSKNAKPGEQLPTADELFQQFLNPGFYVFKHQARKWAKEVGADAGTEKRYADALTNWSDTVDTYAKLTGKEWNNYIKSQNIITADNPNGVKPAENTAKTSKRQSITKIIKGIRQYRRPSDEEITAFARKQDELVFKNFPNYKPLPKSFKYIGPL
jgi:hypothetical protein